MKKSKSKSPAPKRKSLPPLKNAKSPKTKRKESNSINAQTSYDTQNSENGLISNDDLLSMEGFAIGDNIGLQGKSMELNNAPIQQQQTTNKAPAQVYQNVMKELLETTNNRPTRRPTTNTELLELKAPALISDQRHMLVLDREGKRNYYDKYTTLESIAKWTDLAPDLGSDEDDENMPPAKNSKAKKMPAKKKKASIFNRGKSKTRKLAAKYNFNKIINDKVSLYQGDMYDIEVDAVVISTNGKLGQMDMSKPLFKRAGDLLKQEINVLKEADQLPNRVGSCVATCGYRCHSYYVIHSHVPLGSEMKELKQCYTNALAMAKQLKIRTIAFPSLGTGGYGISSAMAGPAALDAVRVWMEKNHESVDRIVFVTYNGTDWQVYTKQMPVYFPVDPSASGSASPVNKEIMIEDYVKLNGHRWLQIDVVKNSLATQSVMNSCQQLHLGGCAQAVNDFLFFVLRQTRLKSSLAELDCAGCYHLTDSALAVAAKVFPELTKVAMDGCVKITERGLHDLYGHAKKLKTVSMMGCNVRACSKKIRKSLDLKLTGCPVDRATQELKKSVNFQDDNDSKLKENTTYKLVILRTSSMYERTPSLSSQFGSTSKAEKWEGLIRKETKTMGDATLNVFECDVSLLPLVNTPRSILVMPPIQHTGSYYHRMLSSALTSDFSNPIILLTQGPKEFLENITQRLDATETEMWKTSSQLNWSAQLSAGQLCALNEAMKKRTIVEMKAEIFGSLQLTVKSTQWKNLFQSVNSVFPEFAEYDPESLDACREFLNKRANIDTLGSKGQTHKNELFWLAVLGEIIMVPNSNWFIRDVEFFSNFLNEFAKMRNKNDEYHKLIPWLGDDASAFSLLKLQSQLTEQLGIKGTEAKDLMDNLCKSHLFLSLPLPWLNEFTPEPAGVFYASLPNAPPVDMAKYWPEHWNDEEQDLTAVYDLHLLNAPVPVIQSIQHYASRFIIPVFVWETGFVGHQGCVEVCISESRITEDKYSIVATVRSMGYQNKKKAVTAAQVWGAEAMARIDAAMTNTFQLVRQIVEFSLLSNGTYFVAQVKCPHCRVNDRVHYYDVIKTISNPSLAKCNTFNEVVSLTDLGIDKYFTVWCDHASMGSTFLADSTTRCVMCCQFFNDHPDSLYCMRCNLCMNCIALLKAQEQLVDPDAYYVHSKICDLEDAADQAENSEDQSSSNKSDHSDCFNKSGDLYTMTGYPFILKFDLTLPRNRHVKIRPLAGLDCIHVSCQKQSTDLSIQHNNMQKLAKIGDTLWAEILMQFDNRVVVLRNNQKILQQFEVDGNSAAIMIHFTKTSCSAIIETDNKSAKPQILAIRQGMRLEALDRLNVHLTAPATIEGHNEEGEVKLHFDGWTEKYDYFAAITDKDLHPIGFCQHTSTKLDPPKGRRNEEFSWMSYLEETSASPVPHEFFLEEQSKGTPDLVAEAMEQYRLKGYSEWKVGMKLEAKDRKNPHLTCAATVSGVYDGGKRVKVYFDGWSNNFDYITESTHEDLHPLGYCAHMNIDLQAPKGYQKAFAWLQYLKETKSIPAPYNMFNRNQTNGCPPHAAYGGNLVDTTPGFQQAELDYEKTSPTFKANLILFNGRIPHSGGGTELPYITMLPHKLGKDDLLYPRRSLAQNWASESQAIHMLCARYDFGSLSPSNVANEHQQQWLFYEDLRAELGQCGGRGFGVHLTGVRQSLEQEKLNKFNQLCSKESLNKSLSKSKKKKTVETENEQLPEVENSHQMVERMASVIISSVASLLKGKITPLEDTPVEGWAKQKPLETTEALYRYSLLVYHTLMTLLNCRPAIVMHSWHQIIDLWIVDGGAVSIADICPNHKINSYAVRTWSNNVDLKQVNKKFPFNLSPHLTVYMSVGLAVDWDALSRFRYLYCITIVESNLDDFKAFNEGWVATLQILNLMRNPLGRVPKTVFKLINLRRLFLSGCGISKIPKELTQLKRLEVLEMGFNPIQELPSFMSELTNLTRLNMMGLAWYSKSDIPLTLDTVMNGLIMNGLINAKDDISKHSSKFAKRAQKSGVDNIATTPVELSQLNALNEVMISNYMPRLPIQIPGPIFELRRLQYLDLSYQFIKSVPAEIRQLKQLKELIMDHCENLELISEQLGAHNMQRIVLSNCPSIKTPPLEIVKKGTPSMLAYLKRLLHGFRECKRTKLMMVGLGGAGKTSLVRALLSGEYKSAGTESHEITDGIDIEDWAVRVPMGKDKEEVTINYSVWDFAGQAVYYNTHQFFLSNRSVYLLLWNSRLGYEHAGLDFWLSSISCHAPKAPIFVVGTHADQVYRADLPKEELRQAFPQIQDFFNISSLSGLGVQELAQKLFQATLEQKYMGEKVPTIWLDLEKKILEERREHKIIPYKDVHAHSIKIGLLEDTEVREALQFLHELGSVQYFPTEFLRDRVVINPQWLVDVMACLISVKETAIKEGRFKRKDTAKIWSKYESELHPWLLRLTEEFDLTYYLPSEHVNIVPCLLPEQEPPFEWPKIEDPSIREMKLAYKFQYLPAGLFNRAQTRLCQYADSSAVWKKGSLLHKNRHIALIRQTRDKELSLTVQGPRPENVLFLVHEVLETLIQEFFQGVSYDLSLPCVDCVNSGSQDPHLFSAKQIRRASDLKAPFLQCGKNFHIVCITALQEFVPPSNTSEYEQHLTGMMHDLKELKTNVTMDALFLCHKHDLKDTKSKLSPHQIESDLDKVGISCSFFEANKSKDGRLTSELGVKLSSSLVILTYVSPEFCADQSCSDVYSFIRQSCRKPMIDLVPGLKDDWKKSPVGMLVATEMYVRLRVEKYQHNIQELVKRIESKKTLAGKPKGRDPCPIFLSYCWSNSKEAVMRGTVKIDGAVGPVDPREVDAFLRDNGIKCWLDTRCAREGALFEEISDALRQAKLMIAFVSDEYLHSRNCMLEFRFATGILKLPLVLCAVGTGRRWQTSEIAMLALGAPRVDFQTRNDADFQILLTLIREKLPEEAKNQPVVPEERPDTASSDEPEKEYSAYQELCELAQRKFLQQVSKVANKLKGTDNEFAAPYPRLCYIDALEEDVYGQTRSGTGQKKDKKWSPLVGLSTNQLCLKVLCEFEGGWHTVGEPLQFDKKDKGIISADLFNEAAPYLAQLFSILQHSAVKVNLLQHKELELILLDLKERALDGTFEAAYKLNGRLTRQADKKSERGGLLRCSLHSRRIVWLCPEHQQMARGTIANDVLDADDIGFVATAPDKPELTKQLTLQSLRTSDHSEDTADTTVPTSPKEIVSDAEDETDSNRDEDGGETAKNEPPSPKPEPKKKSSVCSIL